MNGVVTVRQLGRMKYSDAWELQKRIANEVLANAKNNKKAKSTHELLLVEHDPVYTTGIRTCSYSREEESKLRALGADFKRTNRGGLITFHGPGQLVAYPIIHLRSFGKGIRWYVSALEEVVINCLREFGVKAQTTEDTGIWIENRKICAIGIQGRHVTTHGLALNCDVDLKWFDHIVPCGLHGKEVTSLSRELGERVRPTDVESRFLRSFADLFDVQLERGRF